jgi:hypothetical protein
MVYGDEYAIGGGQGRPTIEFLGEVKEEKERKEKEKKKMEPT